MDKTWRYGIKDHGDRISIHECYSDGSFTDQPVSLEYFKDWGGDAKQGLIDMLTNILSDVTNG